MRPGTGGSIAVQGTSSSDVYGGYPRRASLESPTVTASLNIARHDTDARVTSVVIFDVMLVLVAGFLISLQKIVVAAREGEPFARANVRRLRIAGLTVAAMFAVMRIGASALDHKIDLPKNFPLCTCNPLAWGSGLRCSSRLRSSGSPKCSAPVPSYANLKPQRSEMPVQVHLDDVLARRGMTLTQLSETLGITLANLSILKTGKARAIRFSTLEAICQALDCQPGDILTFAAPGRR
jgi:putative transcriptional regulator